MIHLGAKSSRGAESPCNVFGRSNYNLTEKPVSAPFRAERISRLAPTIALFFPPFGGWCEPRGFERPGLVNPENRASGPKRQRQNRFLSSPRGPSGKLPLWPQPCLTMAAGAHRRQSRSAVATIRIRSLRGCRMFDWRMSFRRLYLKTLLCFICAVPYGGYGSAGAQRRPRRKSGPGTVPHFATATAVKYSLGGTCFVKNQSPARRRANPSCRARPSSMRMTKTDVGRLIARFSATSHVHFQNQAAIASAAFKMKTLLGRYVQRIER